MKKIYIGIDAAKTNEMAYISILKKDGTFQFATAPKDREIISKLISHIEQFEQAIAIIGIDTWELALLDDANSIGIPFMCRYTEQNSHENAAMYAAAAKVIDKKDYLSISSNTVERSSIV